MRGREFLLLIPATSIDIMKETHKHRTWDRNRMFVYRQQLICLIFYIVHVSQCRKEAETFKISLVETIESLPLIAVSKGQDGCKRMQKCLVYRVLNMQLLVQHATGLREVITYNGDTASSSELPGNIFDSIAPLRQALP